MHANLCGNKSNNNKNLTNRFIKILATKLTNTQNIIQNFQIFCTFRNNYDPLLYGGLNKILFSYLFQFPLLYFLFNLRVANSCQILVTDNSLLTFQTE